MLKCTIENTFSSLYDVCDAIDNDIDALRSRIFYVQNREECSWNSDVYLFFFFVIYSFLVVCLPICPVFR